MQHAGGYRPRDGALPVEWIVALPIEWIVAHHQPADLSAASLKIARVGAGLVRDWSKRCRLCGINVTASSGSRGLGSVAERGQASRLVRVERVRRARMVSA